LVLHKQNLQAGQQRAAQSPTSVPQFRQTLTLVLTRLLVPTYSPSDPDQIIAPGAITMLRAVAAMIKRQESVNLIVQRQVYSWMLMVSPCNIGRSARSTRIIAD